MIKIFRMVWFSKISWARRLLWCFGWENFEHIGRRRRRQQQQQEVRLSDLNGPQGGEAAEDTSAQLFQLVEAQVEVEQGVQLTEGRRILKTRFM